MKNRTFMLWMILSFVTLLSANAQICHAEEKQENIRASLIIPAPDQVQVLKLMDGSTMTGRIDSVAATTIIFQTSFGTYNLNIATIKNCQTVSDRHMREGVYWYPNPDRTTGVLFPTGRLLKKDTRSLSLFWFVFPDLEFGLTDNINMGGGLFWIGHSGLFYLHGKAGGELIDNVHVAVGGNWFFTEGGRANFLYTAATWEIKDASLTACALRGSADNGDDKGWGLILGGDVRVSRHAALVTESWFMSGADRPIMCGGIRFFRERSSVLISVFNFSSSDGNSTWPYLRFCYTF